MLSGLLQQDCWMRFTSSLAVHCTKIRLVTLALRDRRDAKPTTHGTYLDSRSKRRHCRVLPARLIAEAFNKLQNKWTCDLRANEDSACYRSHSLQIPVEHILVPAIAVVTVHMF